LIQNSSPYLSYLSSYLLYGSSSDSSWGAVNLKKSRSPEQTDEVSQQKRTQF
jgi:hypothetical protein